MATGSVVVSVLDVGQGQGTFVEVYSTTGALTNTLLFDLGSAKSSKTAGGSSISYIANKIANMTKPKLDYLSLSHKDRDHVNLLKKLVAAINTKIAPKKFLLGKVRYGGAKSWYSGDLIKTLEKASSDVSSLNLRHSCYNKSTKKWEPIWNENDVFVYIMLANIPTNSALKNWSQVNVKGKPDSELANSVSIISTVWWNNNQFFINGDATFITFQEFNKIYNFLPKFNSVKMVTLPHHGSRKTTLGLSSSTATASASAKAVVDTFAKKINASTVTASAEIFGKYHHPSLDAMGLFSKYADKTYWLKQKTNLDKNRHYITAYLDVTLKNSKGVSLSGVYSSFESATNVYTTLYAAPGYIHGYSIPPTNPVGPGTKWPPTVKKPVFPVGVQWTYTINSKGAITLTSPANRQPSVMALKNDTVTDTQAMVEVPTEEIQILSPNNTNVKVTPTIGANGKILKRLKVFK